MNKENQKSNFTNFTFFGDYLENLKDLPIDEQNEIIVAIVRYTSAGEQPCFSKPYLQTIFNCVKFSLDKSASSSKRGQGRKSNQNQTEIKLKSNRNQIEIKKKSNRNQTPNNMNMNMNNNKNINVFMSELGATSDENTNLFGEKTQKPNLSQEFRFYLGAFNHLFQSHYRISPEKQKKFATRRKTISLEDIITSLLVMGNDEFYQGKGKDGWKATPEYHLRNDENILKFIEKGMPTKERLMAKQAIDDKWEFYTKNVDYTQQERLENANA